MILRNVKDKNPTTVEFYEDFEKPSTLKPGKAHVKEDHDGLELCTCCGVSWWFCVGCGHYNYVISNEFRGRRIYKR